MPASFQFLPSLSSENPWFEPVVQLLATALESPVADVRADLQYQQQRQPLQVWVALDPSGEVVGAKLGYERQPGQYYSWLGGVAAPARGQGLGAELMRQQHRWCQQQGYRRIRTQTFNRWRAMLLLNLRHGFDIVGTVQGARGLTIVLEKDLTSPECV